MHFAARSATTLRLVLSVLSSTIPYAHAQEIEETSADREAARQKFEEGERAYEARDYTLAAKAFAEAYAISPHHASLWNCARSWERAHESARAANAYVKYLRLAPPDAPDREAAATALAALAESLGRIDVYATEMDAVRVDDEFLDGTSVYVTPGTHVIEGQAGEIKIRRTEILERGVVRAVALVPEKKGDEISPKLDVSLRPTASPSIAPLVEAPRISSHRKPMHWYGPAAIAAGGATIVSASLLLWSGLDTLDARKTFDVAPTADKLEAGKDKQFRTNVFIGATIGSALATATFVSLWQWGSVKTNSALTIVPPVAGLPMQMMATGSF